MSRRSEHESSLDLLLDTICNMFGMVIFIAVLAAVLAGARGEQSIAEIRQVDLEPLQTRLQQLEDEEEDAPAASDQFIKARTALATRIEHNQRLEALIEDTHSQLTATDTASDIAAQQRVIATLHQALAEAKASEHIPVRTPRRHTIQNRLPVQIVLTDDRFLLVNDWRDWRSTPDPVNERCRFWSTWNSEVVDDARSTFEDHGSCEFRSTNLRIDRSIALLPQHGPRLGVQEDLARIESLLSQLDPKQHYVSFRVTPDSFDRFHDARRLIIERGFEHNVEPITLGDDLMYHDRIERGAAIAQ